MKENCKDILTIANIKTDLKKCYRNQIISSGICTIIISPIMACIYHGILNMSIDTWRIVLLILLASLLHLTPITYFIYNCYKYFCAPKKFKIEVDIFCEMEERHAYKNHYRIMHFSRGKYYRVLCHHDLASQYNEFYTWSKTWRMDELEFGRSAKPQDMVYLVTHNNKTEYVYFEKMFTPNDEVKAIIT